MTNTKSLTRNLSGRARILFAEWTATILRKRAGGPDWDDAERAAFLRRLDTLQPHDRRRLTQASDRWLEEHPVLAAHDEDEDGNPLDTPTPPDEVDLVGGEPSFIEDGIYLGAIRADLREAALCDFRAGLIERFLFGAQRREGGGQQDPLNLVVKNAGTLHAGGKYEPALVYAYKMVHTRYRWPTSTVRWLFSLADPAKLRASGHPLPGDGPVEVFRGGAAGASLSWARDPLVAAWFALQSQARVIRRATLAASDVAAYFPFAIIGAAPPRDEREAAAEARRLEDAGLTEIAKTLRGWVTEKSDEFITTAVLESVAFDEDEAQDLMDRVAP